MKRLITLISFMLLVFVSLNAVNPVRGLGSSFSLLIPDVYEDTKVFPDRLSLQEQRFVQTYTNMDESNSSFYSISPLQGNFRSRHDLKFKAMDSQSIEIDRVNATNGKKIDFNNYFSFKVGRACLGIKASILKNDSDSESITDRVSFQNDYQRYETSLMNRDNGSTTYNFGMSSGLGRDNSLSIALNAKVVENDFDFKHSSVYEYLYPNQINYRLDKRDNLETETYDYESYKLSIIKDLRNESKSRLLLEMEVFESENLYSDYDYRLRDYQSEDYQDLYIKDDLLMEAYDTEGYMINLGYGAQAHKNKFDFYYAGNLNISSTEISGNKVISGSTLEDSLETVFEPITSDFEATEYNGYISIPLGMVFNITKWARFMSSVNMKTEFSKTDSGYVDMLDELHWNTEVIQNIGWEFYPVKNLELGVYNMSDLTDYRQWELSVRYLF